MIPLAFRTGAFAHPAKPPGVGADGCGQARMHAVRHPSFGAFRFQTRSDQWVGRVRQLRGQVMLDLAIEPSHQPADEPANDRNPAVDVDGGPQLVELEVGEMSGYSIDSVANAPLRASAIARLRVSVISIQPPPSARGPGSTK
jgi:hypothetical protein